MLDPGSCRCSRYHHYIRDLYLSWGRRLARRGCLGPGIAGDADGPLFRTTGRKTGNAQALWQQDVYRMIQRRAAAVGIKTRIGNHTFRATGITAYLKNKGLLEHAQTIANHASPRTTKLYDRRSDQISLDEVEKIAI
jgi:integrase/recombinase XerD